MIKKICSCIMAIVILLGIASLGAGCRHDAQKKPPANNGVLHVVCTNYIGGQFAAAVCRDALSPAGWILNITTVNQQQDMHSFEPDVRTMQDIATADVLICIGGTSEAWLEKALKAAGRTPGKDLTVVSMMEICEAMEEQVPEGAETAGSHDHAPHTETEGTKVEYDEHIWTSIKNDILIVRAIQQALSSVAPDFREAFGANADAYVAELQELQRQYEQTVSSASRRALVIADRYPFAYLFRDLGLACYAAFPGCSSETQASFATQMFLIEKVKELNLPYVFVADGGQGSIATIISRETGAGILTLVSGQNDPGQDMTYLDILRQNLENLAKALA